MITPPSAGPIAREALNRLELSAIAFGRLRPPDHLDRERLADRGVEDLHGAGHAAEEEDLPHRGVTTEREPSQRRGAQREGRLRGDECAALVQAVGDDAAREPQQRVRPELAHSQDSHGHR